MAIIAPIYFKTKSSQEILLRSYASQDVLQMIDFVEQVAHESTHTLKYPGMPAADAESLARRVSEGREHDFDLNLGAFCDGKLIGNIKLFRRNPNHPWTNHMASFAMSVSQEFWGQNVADQMLDFIFKYARINNIQRLEAEVRCENTRGVAFYNKHGFHIEGRREKAAYIDDQYVDEYYIAKFF
jgi:RimJ/RimL family protein N-acetyltransferase